MYEYIKGDRCLLSALDNFIGCYLFVSTIMPNKLEDNISTYKEVAKAAVWNATFTTLHFINFHINKFIIKSFKKSKIK